MLKMKSGCERCSAPLGPQDAALICSYECTYCPACGDALAQVCPNCDGELVRRPTRLRSPLPVATSLLRRKLANWHTGGRSGR